MQFRNSEVQYGVVTKSLHWIMALLVICLLGVGLYMGTMSLSAAKIQVYNLHKSLGICVLFLIIGRICWHIISRTPHFVETLKPWEKKAATLVHFSLYILLIAMPLSGWIFSSAAGRPVQFFGIFTLPDIVAPDENIAKTFRALHGYIGYALMALIAMHIAGALKHHFIDKDPTLKRMLPGLFAFLFLGAIPAHAGTNEWILVHDKSQVTFTGKQMGTAFTGKFERFKTNIVFDPDHLDASAVTADIDIASVNTEAADRDENIKGKEWFDVGQFPLAQFQTTKFRKTGNNTYEAEANLTIKNISIPVILPFTLNITKSDSDKTELATVDGTVVLDRAKFQLGTGSWADPSVIANEVPVNIHVVARRAD